MEENLEKQIHLQGDALKSAEAIKGCSGNDKDFFFFGCQWSLEILSIVCPEPGCIERDRKNGRSLPDTGCSRDRGWCADPVLFGADGGVVQSFADRGKTPVLLPGFFDHSPAHQVLQLFVSPKPEHFLSTTRRVPCSQLFMNDVEELFELEGGFFCESRHEFFGDKIRKTTGKSTFPLHSSRAYYHALPTSASKIFVAPGGTLFMFCGCWGRNGFD